MNVILNQIGDLIVGSVPTIVFFVLLVIAYGVLVRGPLDKVLVERRARTSGAIEQARGAMNAAEAETAVFEDKLRGAKAEIFHAREQKLKQWNAERDQALERARDEMQRKVGVARESLDKSASTAKQQIELMSAELSAQVLKAVLPAGVAEVAQ